MSSNQIDENRIPENEVPKNHAGQHMKPYLRAANIGWSGLLLDDVKQMNFSPREQDVYRLLPGDIILSGTPAFSRPVQPGDVVSVEVQGLGTLTNTIVEGPIR